MVLKLFTANSVGCHSFMPRGKRNKKNYTVWQIFSWKKKRIDVEKEHSWGLSTVWAFKSQISQCGYGPKITSLGGACPLEGAREYQSVWETEVPWLLHLQRQISCAQLRGWQRYAAVPNCSKFYFDKPQLRRSSRTSFGANWPEAICTSLIKKWTSTWLNWEAYSAVKCPVSTSVPPVPNTSTHIKAIEEVELVAFVITDIFLNISHQLCANGKSTTLRKTDMHHLICSSVICCLWICVISTHALNYLVELQIDAFKFDGGFVAHRDEDRVRVLKLGTFRSLRRHRNKINTCIFLTPLNGCPHLLWQISVSTETSADCKLIASIQRHLSCKMVAADNWIGCFFFY